MIIRVSSDAVLRIVRAFAAAQVMADREGDGTANHPLQFLLDKRRTLLFREHFSNAWEMLLFELYAYTSITPHTTGNHDVECIIETTPSEKVSAEDVRRILEQLVACRVIESIYTAADPSGKPTRFADLAAHYLNRLINLYRYVPRPIRPLYY